MEWFSHITHTTHIANVADWLCRVWQFLYNMIMYTAGWIIVACTIDRFVMVWHERQAQDMCSVFMAKIVMIIIGVGLFVISVHSLWTYELTPQGCYIDPMQHDFQTTTWPWISATLCSYLPLVLIFIFLILIIAGLISPFCTENLRCCRQNPPCCHGNNQIVSHPSNGNPATQSHLTILTVVVATCHLLFNLPNIIVNFIEYNYNEASDTQYRRLIQLLFARTVGQSISCLNCAISCFLFFTIVPSFRKELIELIKRLKFGSEPVITSEMQTIEINGSSYPSKQGATSATLV